MIGVILCILLVVFGSGILAATALWLVTQEYDDTLTEKIKPNNVVRAQYANHSLYGAHAPVVAIKIGNKLVREFELKGRVTPYGNVAWKPGELDAAIEKAMDEARLVVASCEAVGIEA